MAKTTDPVCGMVIDDSSAAGTVTRDGTTYFFCSGSCQERFEAAPEQYTLNGADGAEG
ncbi:MAG: YHS domain-containing protein [Candidatus Dormibacteria bacterium]